MIEDPPIRRGCGSTYVHDDAVRTIHRRRDAMRSVGIVESVEPIHLEVHYWVLHRNAAENIALARLEAQHQMLNECFNGLNSRLARVPSSGRYAHRTFIGVGNIVFLPSDASLLKEGEHVTRVPITSSLDGLLDALGIVSSNGGIRAGVLNIICAPLNGILGEAGLTSSYCVVHSGSVGGDSASGTLSSYRLGITAVHEVGHCLSLPHVFSGSSCSQPFSDIPAQRYPNYDFELVSEGDSWAGTTCNRLRDCKIYESKDNSYVIGGLSPPYSCFSCTGLGCTEDCASTLHEQAMNFMDYSTDEHLVMFSGQQVLAMRDALVSGDTGVMLRDSDGGEVAFVSPEDEAAASVGSAPGVTSVSELGTWAIVGISLGAVGFVAIIVGIVIWYRKRKHLTSLD